MKGIRRSLNKDRIGAPTPTYSSLPTAGLPSLRQAGGARPTAAPAPAPPKRVIRATAAYRARSNQELSFVEGDFFHVVSDEGGEEWFDAANPMTGARGLVPADHFQVLGRNVRETAQVAGGVTRQPSNSHLNGSAPPKGPSSRGYSAGPSTSHMPKGGSGPTSPPAGGGGASGSSRGSRPTSQPKSQPLYGIVQYDFVAERADELDAKRGEPIIVIAQSNHEWFVAKPIGRLGGPGLIPVAFVEIQDMTTGKPVDNVEELIRSAVVPKVEEWKKMTADYKSQSIPLGRFDFAQPSQPQNQPPPPLPAAPEPQNIAQTYQDHQQRGNNNYSYDSPDQQHHDTFSPQAESEGYGEEARYSYTRERRQYGLVTSASVESFHQEEGSFWFHLRAFFSTGASLVLYRLYQDFYDFQIALMDEFPVEAGRASDGSGRQAERILPMMPGPTDYEDEVVCAQRVHDLSIYLADLCALPDRIRGSGLMYEFLVPRAGDVEVAKGNGKGDQDMPSIEGQYGELVEYLDQMDGSGGAGALEQGMGQMSLSQGEDDYYHQQDDFRQQQQSRQSNNSNGPAYRSHSTEPHGGGYSDYPQQQQSRDQQPMGTANQGVAFVKIKIFHRNTDDLIAIRVPPTVSQASLMDKVRERLGNDVVNLRFREEVGSTPTGGSVVMAGGARLIGIEDDLDLERWIRSGARLVLYAD